MIQRVQSLYFLIAAVFFVLPLCVPVAHFLMQDGRTEAMFVLSSLNGVFGKSWEVAFFAVWSAALSIVSIFSYRRRSLQIRLANLLVLNAIVTCILMSARIYFAVDNTQLEFSAIGIGTFSPLLGIVSVLLARKAVRNDEELVRAADRIR